MKKKIIAIAKEAIQIEVDEIIKIKNSLNEAFADAVIEISKLKGKLIVTGMGKSGLIGRKIAATLSSTGTPSFFLHPADAFHGDLGVVSKPDILLAISYSGETDEVLQLIPFFKENGNLIIGMTSNSTLGNNSNFHLNISIDKEACPLRLAPTSSTTATLVLGDALAVALMKMKSFKEENFATFHPGGNLGKKLLSTVKDIMHMDNVPTVNEDDNIIQVVKSLTKGKLGLCLVKTDIIIGIITDGDLRRAMEKYGKSFFDMKPKDIMTKSPKYVEKSVKIIEAQSIMVSNKIGSLLVGTKDSVIGVVQIYDIEL